MDQILEVTPQDISGLDEKQLTELLLQLLRMEAQKYEIPKSGISGSLEIKAADGGEDAHIKWNGGKEKTDWIPNRYSLFQCKAEDIPPGKCETEILSGNELKPRVKEVLDANGSYILFFTKMCNQSMKNKRENAIRNGIQKTGALYHKTADIKIYDANSISIWVNAYLPLIIKVCTWLGRRFPNCFTTWDDWEKYYEDEVNYVSDELLSNHVSQLKEYFTGTRKVARIVDYQV